MTGTAWQCVGCGPTKVTGDNVDVPERLAQLIEEEYKRVVFGAIYPRSAGLTTTVNQTETSNTFPIPSELLPGLRTISRRQLGTAGQWYASVVKYVGIASIFLIAVTFALGYFFGKTPAWLISALIQLALALGLFIIGIVLRLAGFRRRLHVFSKSDRESALSRSPSRKIESSPMEEKIKQAKRTNADLLDDGGSQKDAP
jgi:hypothetical protein